MHLLAILCLRSIRFKYNFLNAVDKPLKELCKNLNLLAGHAVLIMFCSKWLEAQLRFCVKMFIIQEEEKLVFLQVNW